MLVGAIFTPPLFVDLFVFFCPLSGNAASERIKEVYRQLRQTRADIKQVEKLLDEMRKQSHLFPRGSAPNSGGSQQNRPMNAPGRGGPVDHRMIQSQVQNQRMGVKMRYFKSLNLTPAMLTTTTDLSKDSLKEQVMESAKRMEEEWKAVVGLFKSLEEEQKEEAASSEAEESDKDKVEQFRRQFRGVLGLPSPQILKQNEEPGDDSGNDTDNEAAGPQPKQGQATDPEVHSESGGESESKDDDLGKVQVSFGGLKVSHQGAEGSTSRQGGGRRPRLPSSRATSSPPARLAMADGLEPAAEFDEP